MNKLFYTAFKDEMSKLSAGKKKIKPEKLTGTEQIIEGAKGLAKDTGKLIKKHKGPAALIGGATLGIGALLGKALD